jgi:hypothetical protein
MWTLTLRRAALVLLAAGPAVLGQVTTDCNPMERDDCPVDPAFGGKHTFDFSVEPSETLWETVVRGVEYDSEHGAIFTINQQGNSPTLRTNFYFWWGRTEIHIKCASGQGIISSMMWLSDILDEVDFEMFGTKGGEVATNFFGKGVQKFTNGGEHKVDGDIREEYYNYTTVWTEEKLDWWINGVNVRTLNAADAGKDYPQTPMRLSLGIWAGGDPNLPEGTRQWAGGDTDYSKAPFVMYVKNATVEDYSKNAAGYSYTDRKGMASSINITTGTSEALENIQNGRLTASDDNVQEDTGPTLGQSASNSWDKLSASTKTAIFSSVGGTVGLIAAVGAFYCFRQRRRGRAQATAAEQRWNEERAAQESMRKAGINPDSFSGQSTEYDPRSLASEKGAVVATTAAAAASATTAIAAGNYDRNNSLRRENSWELQPQQAWDPTSGSGAGAGPVDGLLDPPRSPPRSAAAPAPEGSPDGGFDYRSQSPGPVPRSYTSPRQQFDNYSYGRL